MKNAANRMTKTAVMMVATSKVYNIEMTRQTFLNTSLLDLITSERGSKNLKEGLRHRTQIHNKTLL